MCKLEKEAILRDFLSFWTWQRQKRINSVRPPQILNLTASKRNNSARLPQFLEVDNIKSEAILRDFLQKWKVECRAYGLVPIRFAIFQYCTCHEKVSFSLANVLRATTACNFSSIIWSHGHAPAALASLLFNPPEPQIIGKTQCFATFLPFRAHGSEKKSLRRKKIQVREKVGFCFSNDVWLRRVENCGASWPDERWKIARRCGAKHISKSNV